MVLKYMLSDSDLVKRRIAEREATERGTKTKQQIKTKRRALTCLLLLANMIVANAGYNLWIAGENTPVWKLCTASVIRDLWTTRKSTLTAPGTIEGILHSEENPCALVSHELVHEGDIINGIKVIRIDRREVEFEKNGEKWIQKVLENPNPAWEIKGLLAR